MISSSSLPHIAVVMAVYRPDPGYLAAQMGSFASQDWQGPLTLFAVIADRASTTLVQKHADALGLPLTLVTPPVECDAVRAFEAGLTAVYNWSEETGVEPFVALSDQDDIWHSDRISCCYNELVRTGAALVHSDARLVNADGTERHPSMMTFERRNVSDGIRQILYRNTVTGMTVLMRADVMRIALPFPAQSGVHFYHDLWLGLVASGMDGGIYRVRTPLVDYRQHERNAIGAIDRQRTGTFCLPRFSSAWLRRNAGAYALARYLAISIQTRLTEAETAGLVQGTEQRLAPLRPLTRHLRGFGAHLWDAAKLASSGHSQVAQIAFGYSVVSLGRPIWALREALSTGLSYALEQFDTRLFEMSPGQMPRRLPSQRSEDTNSRRNIETKDLIDARKSPTWTTKIDQEATPVLNILVPTLNPSEVFAGIATAVDIGLGMAERGVPVRFISTDLPLTSIAAARSFLNQRRETVRPRKTTSGATFSIVCGKTTAGISISPRDRFLSTAWWTAHIAKNIIEKNALKKNRFHYLIQDFEPNFYAWGPEFADAIASYGMNFEPIFNTTLLRDHFSSQGFDFATPDRLAFHPAIDISRYSETPRPLRPKRPRRLALYGRPEVARNMFPMAIEALKSFIEMRGLTSESIELISVGLRHEPIILTEGVRIESLGKLPFEEYPDFLRSIDVGLSLMYSPHPSHPPIEMAASGVRVVTNHFGSKNLSLLGEGILSIEPTAPAIASALSQAWDAPPVSEAARQIDLRQLGEPFSDFLDALVEHFPELRIDRE